MMLDILDRAIADDVVAGAAESDAQHQPSRAAIRHRPAGSRVPLLKLVVRQREIVHAHLLRVAAAETDLVEPRSFCTRTLKLRGEISSHSSP